VATLRAQLLHRRRRLILIPFRTPCELQRCGLQRPNEALHGHFRSRKPTARTARVAVHHNMRGTVDKLCTDVANEKKISGDTEDGKCTLSIFALIGSQKHTLKGPDKLRGYGRFGKVPFHFVCLSAVDCAEKKLLKLSTFRTVVPIVFQLEG